MKKKDRHAIIKDLVNDEVLKKQDDFVYLLNKRGIVVTQATISRDIRELNLIKVPSEGGGYQYSLSVEDEEGYTDRLRRLIKDAFVAIDSQKEMVILKTIPGNAFALGHLIENINYEEVFGVVSGDDTILIICRSPEDAKAFKVKIIDLI